MVPYKITRAEVTGPYRLRLTFADGLDGDVDLSSLRDDRGEVFAPLRDRSYFDQVTVDPELGTVVWPNGADLAPDVLYNQVRGQSHATCA
jgi:Protein of unknown function (DUF2442)